jgi:hypothetical protein
LRQETREWIDAALVQYDSPTGNKAG